MRPLVPSRSAGAGLDEIEAAYRAGFVSFVRVATAITGDPETGRDAVQDAFANAVRTRESFRRRGSLEGWLWKAVVNSARSARRAARPATDLLPALEPNGGYDPREAAVRVGVSLLPERQRHVVFLRYFADLDHAAIAAALGMRPGTVGATLNQAHAALRRQVEEVTS